MSLDINYERRGSGEPLVLIHGIGSRWEIWLPVIDALAVHHDVIALDLPGFGRSPKPAGDPKPGLATLADLVLEFCAELGVKDPHVAGNSMGGAIALELARRGVVRSATALSPSGFLSPADTAYTLPLLMTLLHASRLLRPLAGPLSATAAGRTALLAPIVRHPQRLPAAQAALWLEGMADATWFEPTMHALTKQSEMFHDVGELAVPTTIAWGEHDWVLRPHQARRALAEFKSAHYVKLHDCGHVPTWDDPELVAKTLLTGTAV